MPGKLQVVVGGQFGSEAKGAVAAHLAAKEDDLFAVRVAGPNAGHTVIGNDGREWKLQQIPVAAVSNRYARLGWSVSTLKRQGVLVNRSQDVQHRSVIRVGPARNYAEAQQLKQRFAADYPEAIIIP